MLEDFKRALARVQTDFGFYVECQTNPAVALAGYDLSVDERKAMTDPARLSDILVNLRPSITIKISGTHDWVNAVPVPLENTADPRVATQVEAIKGADTDRERSGAVVRLMEIIG